MYRLSIPLLYAILSVMAVFWLPGCGGGSSGPEDEADLAAAIEEAVAVDEAAGETSGDREAAASQEYSGVLVINEIVAKGADGGPDWVELYVVSGGSVDLGSYFLSDDAEDREKAPLPDIILKTGEFAVIQAVDEPPADGSDYVPFKLGADDAVVLYKGETVIDAIDWEDGDAPEGFSFGRLPDGTGGAVLLAPTPGAANAAGGEDEPEEVPRPDGWEEESHGDTAAPNYPVVFAEGTVLRLDVAIDGQAWESMLDEMTALFGEFGGGMSGIIGSEVTPMWVPCDVSFQGRQWHHVGIRFKGNLSLESAWGGGSYKLPLRLDFDEFEDTYPEIDDQRFYGFKKLGLSNNSMDDSLIREKVVADIFRDAGVPAPRTAFYRLFIDFGEGPVYFGLYTMVEIPDKPMLSEQFVAPGGNLYKPEGDGARFVFFDEDAFEKKTNEDAADYSDIEALFDALHAGRADADVWRSGLESAMNVGGFLRWLAVNTVIQNWDTYGRMAHNYYLYNDPNDGRLNWIPWDNHLALNETGMQDPLPLPLSEVDADWPLIRYLMDDPVFHGIYVDEIQDFLDDVFYPDRMRAIYESAHELIRPYVVGDEGENDGHTLLESPGFFDSGLDYLENHVAKRYADAHLFVEAN